MHWRRLWKAVTGSAASLLCACRGCKLPLAAARIAVLCSADTSWSLRRECVELGRAAETTLPQHCVRPLQLFSGLNVCLHRVAPVMLPGKMEEALVARGAAVSFQVQQQQQQQQPMVAAAVVHAF